MKKANLKITFIILAAVNLANAVYWCFKGNVCFELFSLYALHICIKELKELEK